MIPIFLCFDNNYASKYMHVVNSIRRNTKEETKIFFITQQSVGGKLGKRLNLDFSIYPHGFVKSKAMYYRWLIPQTCNYDKAIYLDNDVVITGDINDLYNIDIGNNLIGAVRDKYAKTVRDTLFHQGKIDDKKYNVNIPSYFSGQLLINCKSWREEKIAKKLFDFIFENHTLDMATINIICAGRIHEISNDWCVSANYEEREGKLYHWHGKKKPWDCECMNQKIYEKYL